MWTRTYLSKALWLLKLTLQSVFDSRFVRAQTCSTADKAARPSRSRFLVAVLAICSLNNLIAPVALAAEQDALLEQLLVWIADYYRRDGVMSWRAHRALFDGYEGPKVAFTSEPPADFAG